MPATPQKTPIVQIYDELNGLFGSKAGQIFTMEYPGRILDMGSYAYKDSGGIDAQQTKPQAVVEAEFRLSDDLYSLGQLTGAPKGSKLSEVYQQILSSLTPGAAEESTFDTEIMPDQTLINGWLLEDVPNWVLPADDPLDDIPDNLSKHVPQAKVSEPANSPPKIPRIDLYQKLLTAYEDARFRWEKFKLNARPKKQGDVDAWDTYNRTMAVFEPAVDAKLEGLWGVLLVRGEYHRVRHYLGLIDVESGSEALLSAKESLRASVMRSVDDTQDIYPVELSPASWANYLTTDFEPVDLMMTPEVLMQKLSTAEDQRRTFMDRLGDLKSAKQDIPALQKTADTARDALTTAQNTMLNGLSDATINLIQIYLKTATGGVATDMDKSAINGVLSTNKQPPLTETQFNQIQTGQANCITAQSNFLTASEAVARTQSALASGISSDPTMAISQTQAEIESLTAYIDTLTTILKSSKTNVTGYDITTGAAAPPAPPVLTGTLIPPPHPKKGASEWQTITIDYQSANHDSSSSLNSSGSQSDFSADALFWSASSSSSSGQSSASDQMKATTTNVSLGMNVMKVEINRPWLDASIFSSTADYVRLDSTPISTGFDSSLLAGTVDANTLKAQDEGSRLIAYPVAFLIAKDITIAMTDSQNKAASAHDFMQKAFASGGGCLCFSVSRSNSSSTSTQSAYSEADASHINIKIPGAQIIGWIMQCTPKDKSSTKYTPLDTKQFQTNTNVQAYSASKAKL